MGRAGRKHKPKRATRVAESHTLHAPATEWPNVALALAGAALFAILTPARHAHFDYTYRVADALLHGHVGLRHAPPSWLNEFVPLEKHYYSVFPLGAVLSQLPAALFHRVGLINAFPARGEAALLAGACVYFFAAAARAAGSSWPRTAYLALFPIFATWSWCNLGFAGAWQIALGFALLGGIGSLFFALVQRRPLVAGAFFALAVGNRTEVILTAPLLLWLLCRQRSLSENSARPFSWSVVRESWRECAWFLAPTAVLLFLTASYNLARFHSPFDFGYFHIPKIEREPWFRHGLFSLNAIPWNLNKMLLEGMRDLPRFPYFSPPPFGCSIFLASPFLFLLFRPADGLSRVCWLAIGMLTFALWCHGNPGGWQFSYRYAMILLPWMFLLIVQNGPATATAPELALFVVSVAVNAVATYQFLWTQEVRV